MTTRHTVQKSETQSVPIYLSSPVVNSMQQPDGKQDGTLITGL